MKTKNTMDTRKMMNTINILDKRKILNTIKKLCFLIVIAVCIFDFTGCDKSDDNDTEVTQNVSEDYCEKDSIFAMDTYMEFTVYGQESAAVNAVQRCKSKIEDLEWELSAERNDNEIAMLNSYGIGGLSGDTLEVFNKSLEYMKLTDGAFNPLVHPLMEAWGFNTKKYRIPSDKELKKLIKLTKLANVEFNDVGTVNFKKNGMALDFGGIAKGYSSAALMDILNMFGIKSAMINLGGNIQVLGTKPDGSKWNVAIKNPNSEDKYVGILNVSDKAVVTSGNYERFFEKDGKRYHHIIDPKTGRPAETGLQSVTVVSEDVVKADALSTALFVMGIDSAVEFWKEHRDEFGIVFFTDDEKVYITENIKNEFGSEFDYEIISY